jgi:hypothetical protein
LTPWPASLDSKEVTLRFAASSKGQGLKEANPKATVMLQFEPAEAAQVDFGTGPRITDVFTGEVFLVGGPGEK